MTHRMAAKIEAMDKDAIKNRGTYPTVDEYYTLYIRARKIAKQAARELECAEAALAWLMRTHIDDGALINPEHTAAINRALAWDKQAALAV